MTPHYKRSASCRFDCLVLLRGKSVRGRETHLVVRLNGCDKEINKYRVRGRKRENIHSYRLIHFRFKRYYLEVIIDIKKHPKKLYSMKIHVRST